MRLKELRTHGTNAHLAGELQGGALAVDAGGALKHLHHSFGAIYLQDLAAPRGAVPQLEVDDLCIPGFLSQHSMHGQGCAPQRKT